MENKYIQYVPAIKAISDETRLKIIDMLSCGELCACEILESLEISQSTLSYHMKTLTDCGLVDAKKDGSWIYYSINAECVGKLLAFLSSITSKKSECICNLNDQKKCKSC